MKNLLLINKHQEITLQDFKILESYKKQLEKFIEEFKEEKPVSRKLLQGLQDELQNTIQTIKDIKGGKYLFTSFTIKSQIQ